MFVCIDSLVSWTDTYSSKVVLLSDAKSVLQSLKNTKGTEYNPLVRARHLFKPVGIRGSSSTNPWPLWPIWIMMHLDELAKHLFNMEQVHYGFTYQVAKITTTSFDKQQMESTDPPVHHQGPNPQSDPTCPSDDIPTKKWSSINSDITCLAVWKWATPQDVLVENHARIQAISCRTALFLKPGNEPDVEQWVPSVAEAIRLTARPGDDSFMKSSQKGDT